MSNARITQETLGPQPWPGRTQRAGAARNVALLPLIVSVPVDVKYIARGCEWVSPSTIPLKAERGTVAVEDSL